MKHRGFSFIEILVVLVLLSLSAALLAPTFSRFLKSVELKGTVKKVSAILRYCRSEAVHKGSVYRVIFQSEPGGIKVESMETPTEKEKEEGKESKSSAKTYTFPEGVRMKEVKVEPPQYASDLPSIEFYPNGGSNGGTILFEAEERSGFRIKVHFLTGAVTIEKV
jgi:prepilin-type N-terminal cleavage/methylation domain-containing protein